MAVLRRNPDTLSYLVVQDAYEDGNGDYHEGASTWDGEIRCDAVSNSKANKITFADGTKYEYAYEVHLPHDVKEFSIGEKVKLSFHGGGEVEFDVKGFRRFQKQSKIWV